MIPAANQNDDELRFELCHYPVHQQYFIITRICIQVYIRSELREGWTVMTSIVAKKAPDVLRISEPRFSIQWVHELKSSLFKRNQDLRKVKLPSPIFQT